MANSTKTKSLAPTAALDAEDNAAYLKLLGERVRDARARRGMTRKALSAESGVSERYIAQLESGQGNISILLLKEIAHVLREPLPELVAEHANPAPAKRLVLEQIAGLDADALAALQKWLAAHGRSHSTRSEKIALIGLRGAGKSTLGQRVAARLGIAFVEIAAEIEALAGMSQSEIFSLYGQAAYRRFERLALEDATSRPGPHVFAVGGGLPTELPTFDFLLSRCTVVWLKAQPEEHMSRVQAQGDFRPMAGNTEAMQDLKRILEQRAALYGNADLVFDTSGLSVEAAVDGLSSLLISKLPGLASIA